MLLVKSPNGAFVNTIVLLLWLDKQFNLLIDQQKYAVLRGSSWPDVDELHLVDLSLSLRKEIEQYFILDKCKFIEQNIFPEDRTWDNWIYYESLYRNFWQKGIVGLQQGQTADTIEQQLDQGYRIIGFSCDPYIAYKNKCKFTTSIDLHTKKSFIADIEKFNKKLDSVDHPNLLKLDAAEFMCKQDLDRSTYNIITKWADLEDNYDKAHFVHTLWLRAQTRSQMDFLDEMIGLYS